MLINLKLILSNINIFNVLLTVNRDISYNMSQQFALFSINLFN